MKRTPYLGVYYTAYAPVGIAIRSHRKCGKLHHKDKQKNFLIERAIDLSNPNHLLNILAVGSRQQALQNH